MLDLIRRKSAVGQPPSPSEDASSTAREAPTPKGPLSDDTGDDSRQLASGQTPGAAVGRPGQGGGVGIDVQRGDDEGDNRSFYGSDSQASVHCAASWGLSMADQKRRVEHAG
jgi:hypothetical protein